MGKRLDYFKYSLISLAFSILTVEIIFQYFEAFNLKKFILRTLLVIIYYCIFNELNYRRIYSNRNLIYFISHNICIFFIIIIFFIVLENVLGPLETEYFFHGKYILSTFVISVILYISTVNFFSKIYAYIIFTLCLLLYCFQGYENKIIIYTFIITFFLLLLINREVKINYRSSMFTGIPYILIIFVIALILPTLNDINLNLVGRENESKYKVQGNPVHMTKAKVETINNSSEEIEGIKVLNEYTYTKMVEMTLNINRDNNIKESVSVFNENKKDEFTGIIYVLFGITIIIIFVLIILKVTYRYRKLRKILKLPNEEALENLIAYSIELLRNCNINYSDGETELEFAERVDTILNIEFKNSMQKYYNYKDALKSVSKEDVNKSLVINEFIYKYIKKNKKKLNQGA